jgi:DNA-directed RNA polymerase subunit RPC12/RpoP
VFWKCLKCGEDWDAKISYRTQGSGCPKCARFYFKKQSLLNALPEVVKIWHPTKNSFTPDMVGRGSDRKVWFICEKKHIWQAAVYSVFVHLKKTGKIPCPFCTGKKINKENCILTLFPDLVKEWHPIKNGVFTPENVGKGSTKHVWWLCKKGHEWSTTVNIRTSQETGCPYCNSSRLSIENNLAVVNPSIAKLWHPTKKWREISFTDNFKN